MRFAIPVYYISVTRQIIQYYVANFRCHASLLQDQMLQFLLWRPWWRNDRLRKISVVTKEYRLNIDLNI